MEGRKVSVYAFLPVEDDGGSAIIFFVDCNQCNFSKFHI